MSLTSWITFLFNGFHELDKKRWSDVRGCELLCKVRESGSCKHKQSCGYILSRVIQCSQEQCKRSQHEVTDCNHDSSKLRPGRKREPARGPVFIRRLLSGHHPPALPLPMSELPGGCTCCSSPRTRSEGSPEAQVPCLSGFSGLCLRSIFLSADLALACPTGPTHGLGRRGAGSGWKGAWPCKVPAARGQARRGPALHVPPHSRAELGTREI